MDLYPINILWLGVLILSLIILVYIFYWLIFMDYMPGCIDISKPLPLTPASQRSYFN